MPLSSPVHVAERLFVALDYPEAAPALALAEKLAPLGVSYKVGMQLYYAEGIEIIRRLNTYGKTVFVDLKLHDIPNTVAGAVDSLVRQGAGFLNVHAQGGPDMMRAACEAAQKAARDTNQPTPQTDCRDSLDQSVGTTIARAFIRGKRLCDRICPTLSNPGKKVRTGWRCMFCPRGQRHSGSLWP